MIQRQPITDVSLYSGKLSNLVKSNSQYKHMACIPSLEELEKFYVESSDFFSVPTITEPARDDLFFTAKDVFNTYVLPTEMGSQLWEGHKAGNNARVISAALDAGFKFLGKTKTSEFAVHEPTDTVNPWDSKRMTGTSSSGSAVSILLGEADFSLATQSAASISRPAAYLGIKALKPTFGLVPRTGVLKTCDPFDTVGFFAKNIGTMKDILISLGAWGSNYPKNALHNRKDSQPVVGYFGIKALKRLISISRSMQNEYESVLSVLNNKNVALKEMVVPEYFEHIHESHEIVYTKSLEYYFKNELTEDDKISPSFEEFVELGSSRSPKEFTRELNNHSLRVREFNSWMMNEKVDFLITPAVEGVAPLRNEKELDDLSLFWTYLQVPAITAAFNLDPTKQLPLGFNLISYKRNDLNLIDFTQNYLGEEILDTSKFWL